MEKIEESIKKRSFKEFFAKYFLEGQKYRNSVVTISEECESFDLKIFKKYRKISSFLIPFIISQFFWWCLAIKYDYFELYKTLWQLPTVLILGATVAGITGQGSGAIAYPIMTFVLHLSPITGRDFSIALQSIGMVCGTVSILLNNVKIQWRAVIYQLFGALPAVILAFTFLENLLAPSTKKMIFVSLWSAFAISLYLLNTEKKRITVSKIQNFSLQKAAILVFSGFLGGLFTALTGSGVDICTFAVLTFVFRLSENFAAPSGIAMMALVSQFCVFWRVAVIQEFDSLALDYVKVCVPSVSLFVPLGSFLGSHFHRITIAFLVGVLEILAMAGFLATMPSLPLLLCSVTVIVAGFLLFTILGKIGTRLLQRENETFTEQKLPC